MHCQIVSSGSKPFAVTARENGSGGEMNVALSSNGQTRHPAQPPIVSSSFISQFYCYGIGAGEKRQTFSTVVCSTF